MQKKVGTMGKVMVSRSELLQSVGKENSRGSIARSKPCASLAINDAKPGREAVCWASALNANSADVTMICNWTDAMRIIRG